MYSVFAGLAMLATSRGLRHLAKRTAATSLGNNLLSDPSTLAVASKVTELMQSNTQERQRLNDKLDDQRENVEEKLESALDRYLSSNEAIRNEIKTLNESFQAFDKKVSVIAGAAAFVGSFGAWLITPLIH